MSGSINVRLGTDRSLVQSGSVCCGLVQCVKYGAVCEVMVQCVKYGAVLYSFVQLGEAFCCAVLL